MLVAVTPPAHAYIDPGTAGLLLQAIIGGIVGALFTIRIYWQKIKLFLGLEKKIEDKKAQRDQTDK
ncbi:MAG: hypothetical protein KAT39_06885 [Alphaproteobacteria bacterium]|nr:hypothetical protein [Alphaproteobacteria bacterium]